MSMTMTEKIIAKHAGLEQVKPGQLVTAKVDRIMAHDITGPPAFKQLKKYELEEHTKTEKLALVLDHIVTNRHRFHNELYGRKRIRKRKRN